MFLTHKNKRKLLREDKFLIKDDMCWVGEPVDLFHTCAIVEDKKWNGMGLLYYVQWTETT